MKKFFLSLILILMSARGVAAADLEVTLRLDQQKSGSDPLPILVLIKASSISVENNLNILVGSGWVVDSSVNVSVAGLPTGVTPLPGIGIGNGSGQNINFAINDLAAGTEYGFYITSGISSNPNTGNYTWQVSTNFDSKKINIPITANDQITVTGRVGAHASDFQIGILSDKTGDLSVDEIVTYEITYGSNLVNFTKPLVITASWTRGTVEGSPIPSVDIVDYVVGSGSTGYGGVSPVIDLINNKIIWTINSFPGKTTDQKVTFQLKVNHSYSGQSRVKFDTSAVLSGANVVTTDSTITNYFLPSVPTSTPTESPANNNSTSSSPTTTSIPLPIINLIINKIQIVKITNNEFGVAVDCNIKTPELKIIYGTTLNNLNKSVTSLNNLKSDVLYLGSLKAATNYYFRIIATGENGQKKTSDLYTFKTALIDSGPLVDNRSLVVSINNNVVLDASEDNDPVNSIIIVPDQNYAFRVNLEKTELIKDVRIIVKNSQVLGINTVYGAELNSISVDLKEIVNGGFVGHLVSPNVTGFYDVVLRIEDKNGGIMENKIGLIKVTNFIKIKDQKSKPIENAAVFFSKFNNNKKIYELMSPQSLGIKNPSYTETDGTLNVSLPAGKYQVEIEAIGFENKQQQFTIGLGKGEDMPEIILVLKYPTLLIWGSYFSSITQDLGNYLVKNFNDLISSSRFFNFINLLVVINLLFVGWQIIINSCSDWWQNQICKNKNLTWGKVIDGDTHQLIAGATVVLIDGRYNKVLSKTLTNTWGRFKLDLGNASKFKMTVTKKGYEAMPMEDFSKAGLTMGKVVLNMENIIDPIEGVKIQVNKVLKNISRSVMLTWLLILLIVELVFWRRWGIEQTWLWLLLSWFNIVGWLKK